MRIFEGRPETRGLGLEGGETSTLISQGAGHNPHAKSAKRTGRRHNITVKEGVTQRVGDFLVTVKRRNRHGKCGEFRVRVEEVAEMKIEP